MRRASNLMLSILGMRWLNLYNLLASLFTGGIPILANLSNTPK
ncbi:hypothetical protein [Rubritalea tangerina]